MHGINSFIILLAYFLSFISVLEGHLAEKHVFNGWGGGEGGFDRCQMGGWVAGSGSNQSKTNQDRIKGTEKASPIHTLIHK